MRLAVCGQDFSVKCASAIRSEDAVERISVAVADVHGSPNGHQALEQGLQEGAYDQHDAEDRFG